MLLERNLKKETNDDHYEIKHLWPPSCQYCMFHIERSENCPALQNSYGLWTIPLPQYWQVMDILVQIWKLSYAKDYGLFHYHYSQTIPFSRVRWSKVILILVQIWKLSSYAKHYGLCHYHNIQRRFHFHEYTEGKEYSSIN